MNFRIRNILLVAYLAIGLLPLAIVGWLTYDRMIAREYAEVEERHLLIAQNLSTALSLYSKDVRVVARHVSDNLLAGKPAEGTLKLLNDFNIENVSVVNRTSGDVLSSVGSPVGNKFSKKMLEMLSRHAKQGQFQFTPVWKMNGTYNAIFVVAGSGENLLVGCLSTKYFHSIGKQVSFGEKGHSAIVDQEGSILFHPLPKWTKEAKNLSHIYPVKRMMQGVTGTAQFYSPALKGDMIAGITSVEGPGWGIMVPQPVSELNAKAIENLVPMLIGFAVVAVATLALIAKSIKCLARPLENLNHDMLEQAQSGEPAVIVPSRFRSYVSELTGIAEAYNNLVLAVRTKSVKLAEKTFEDVVTGIGNRHYFDTKSEEQISLRVSQGKRGILIFMDLDGFKEVNDIRGHAMGDRVLQEFAKSLYPVTKQFMDKKFRGAPGAFPVIGRLGGDEFAILLPLPEGDIDIAETCEELRQAFPTSFSIDGSKVEVGVSAGGAVYPEQSTSVDDLVRKADIALYMAKAEGRGCFKLYSKFNALGSKTEILADVVKAMENNELELYYQPKFCLAKQAVNGVEALVRWNHPAHGTLTPNFFLPAIQNTAVMKTLGEWVIARAIEDIQGFEKVGQFLKVAINIGTEHFACPDFLPTLVSMCNAKNFSHDRMQIEVTEDTMDASQGNFKSTVQALQKHGFMVAIDDFGTGFSNLSRIASVPVDIIKLDRSLICDAVSDNRIKVLFQTAVKMAHALNSAVIVEGVETLEQVKLVEETGANALQGFYLSKPLKTEDLSAWLKARGSSALEAQYEELEQAMAS